MTFPRTSSAFLVTALVGALLTVVVTAPPSAADTNPSTAALRSSCDVDRTVSTGTAAGLPAVAPGERVTVSSAVVLDAGQAYQDVVGRPAGSTYFASVIELDPAASPGAVVDPSTATFTVGGTSTPFVAGTQPSPDGYVLDSTGGHLRLYFPGDATAMLANVAGAGLPSIVVPADGTVFALSARATVGTDSNVTAAAPIDLATCRASMSTGPSARTTGDRLAKVGIAEPAVTVAKSVTPATVAPGSPATFTISLANAASSAEAPVGTAYDIAIVDTLPAELVPVSASGAALSDGDVTSSGLTWHPSDHTLTGTVATLDAGAQKNLTLRVKLAADAAAASAFTNHVTATASSLPGSAVPERTYPTVDASATLNSAATTPTIVKAADRDTVVLGNVVNYTVTVTLPPASRYENVTLLDLLPSGMGYQWNSNVSCSGCIVGPSTADLGTDSPTNDSVRFGMYLGAVSTGTGPATITWTYGAWANSNLNDGTKIADGHIFTNTSELRANIVDRLGGVPPRLSTLRPGDFQVSASDSVMAAQPKLAISKRLVGTSPIDPGLDDTTWEVTLTNSGSVDATSVYVYDDDLSPAPGFNTGGIRLLSPAADFFLQSWNMVGVRRVPAQGTYTYRYTLPWYGRGNGIVAPLDDRLTNRVTVAQYADPNGSWVPIPQTITAQADVTLLHPDVQMTKERLSPSIIAVGTAADYRITLTNHGLGSATNIDLTDTVPSGFAGFTVLSSSPAGAIACTGASSMTCALTPDRIAPGQTITFDYRLSTAQALTGIATNEAHLSYTDGANRSQFTDAAGTHAYDTRASADITVVAPKLTFAKTPELDDPGATIDVGGSSAFYMVATNTGNYVASDVVIDDPVPTHLTADLANATCIVFPAAATSTCTVSGPSSHPVFTLDNLAPGSEMRVQLPVIHDGSDPKVVGSEFTNVASLSALGFDTITDEGGLNAQSGPKPPLPKKTVSPTSAGPGETVMYTVDVALQNANATLHDATLIDTVPDGLTDIAPVSITCTTGSCPATLGYIGFEPSPNGGGRAAWFIGDQPLGTTGTVRVVYTARVADAFVGGGIPVAGAPVGDGVPGGDPLKNAARVWFNDGVDRFSGVPSAVPATTTAEFTSRSVNTRVSLDISSPRLTLTKSAAVQSVEAGDRSNPLSIETYTLAVTNTGSRPAYATDVVDDLAGGELRDVHLDGLPSGVTVIDPWTTADPSTRLRIDRIDPGATVTMTYTAVPRPTAEVFDSRYVVRNAANIAAFHSTPDGSGSGDHTYPATTPVRTDIWVYTPTPRVGAAACSDPDRVGQESWFSVNVANYHWQGTPDVDQVGTLHDGVLTVTMGANVTFVPGSVLGIPYGGSEAPYRDPDTLVVNADLTATMTWNLGDVPINFGSQFLGLRWKVTATSVATAGLMVSLTGTDWSAATSRGSAVAATTPYTAVGGAGCVTTRSVQKTPDTGTIAAGGQVTWTAWFSMSTTYRHAQSEHGDFVDILPAGFVYTPGTATFSDGSTVASHSETIVPLPDGTTQITWKDVTVTAPAQSSASVSVSIPTHTLDEATLTLAGPLPRGFVNHIGFTAPASTDMTGTCDGLSNALCDTGFINVESNNQPTITKQVDRPLIPWGDTATYTVDISIPKNYASAGLFARDLTQLANATTPYWPAASPSLTYAPVSASCVAGCTPGGADDVTVTALPEQQVGYPLAVAWKTGAIASDTEARTLRIVYQVQTPSMDDIAAIPGCSTYGYVTEGYYSCGKATFRNTVDLYAYGSSWPLSTLGSDWWNSWWWWGADYRGSATADLTASVPDLRIVKQCAPPGATPTGPSGIDAPTEIEQSALGVANVACTVTVVNDGPGTAYAVQFEDRPAPNSNYGWPVTWDVRSNVSPAPANVDSHPTDGSSIAWTLPELAPGGTYTASFEARTSMPDWATGVQVSSYQSYGTRFSNTATVTSYDPDDFGSVHVADTGGWWSSWNAQRHSSTTWLDLATPRIGFAKQVNVVGGSDPATGLGSGWCQSSQRLTVDGHSLCWGTNQGATFDGDQPLEYHLDVMLSRPDQLRTANLTDQLPMGWGYVPGTARLDHATWDGNGNLVTTSTPLFEPTTTPSSSGSCQWWNVSGGGDQLLWVFSRAATDQAGALWDDALRWTGPSTGYDSQFDATYRITFDVAPTTMWTTCKPLSTPGWDPIGPDVQNQSTLSVTTTADTSGTTSSGVDVRSLAPPRFVKSPKSGYVSANGDAVFTLDTENVQKFGIGAVTVTDTVQDWSAAQGAPLYQPGSATVTDEFGDPVAATEQVAHRSTGPGDPTIITWTYDQGPAYNAGDEPRITNWTCPVSATPDRPYWNECASRVRVTLRLHVPDTEADGYRYANEATAVFPDRTYDPVARNYDGFGSFRYGATLSDTGDYTVVNPSPPPMPSKWGTWWATPNDVVDYYVDARLPAGTTYHDLAYTDVVPDGLTDVRLASIEMFDPSTGTTTALPTATKLGPVVDPVTHTTTVGAWFDEVPGVGIDRQVRLHINARVADRYADGRRVVKGDQLTDTATGYSNEDDLVTTTPATPITSAQHASDPSSASTYIDEPSVQIAKSADRPGPLAAGDTVNYTVRITNNGNVPAFHVPVEDHPNVALTNVVLTGDTSNATKGWTADDPSLAWELPYVYPGQEWDLTYSATVAPDPQTVPAIINSASVGTYQARWTAERGNREYDGPTATNTIRFLSADMRVTKVPNPTGASPCPADDPSSDDQATTTGRATPWCITVTNAGELTAGSVALNDLLPPSWTYVPGSATVDGTAMDPVSTDIVGLHLLRWALGDMTAGASMVVRYDAVPGADSAASVTNTAWAIANRPDGTPAPAGAPGFRSSDTATATLRAVGVEIAKTPDRQMLPLVPTGGRAPWTITVTNPSATDLTNVVVTDHFPTGVTYAPSATTSSCPGSVEADGPMTPTGQDVTWSFPRLDVGQSCAIVVAADVPSGLAGQTTYVNDAQVDTDQTPIAVANQAKLVVYEPVLLGDRVWHDLDGDGIQDPGEPGYSGVDLRVEGADVEGNPIVRTMTTDADGRWLASVPPGTYRVTVEGATLPATAAPTPHIAGTDTAMDSDIDDHGVTPPFTVASGDRNVDIDAGFYESTASVSGIRWHDRNADGVQDPGEEPLAGIVVTIAGCGPDNQCGQLTTTTDATGYYEFTDLPPASGTITFGDEPGATVSPTGRGDDPTVDSDADPATHSIAFVIQSGQHLGHLDEGTYGGADVTTTTTTAPTTTAPTTTAPTTTTTTTSVVSVPTTTPAAPTTAPLDASAMPPRAQPSPKPTWPKPVSPVVRTDELAFTGSDPRRLLLWSLGSAMMGMTLVVRTRRRRRRHAPTRPAGRR